MEKGELVVHGQPELPETVSKGKVGWRDGLVGKNTVLPEDPSSGPSIHTRQLTATCQLQGTQCSSGPGVLLRKATEQLSERK